MAQPIVHLYCLCWNEAAIIPFFLRHYDALVSQFFVWDNNSTDGSLDLLRAHGRVTVIPFNVPGDSFVAEEQRLSETIWRASRGVADWVAVLDMDEFLHHPEPMLYLKRCSAEGVTAIRAVGFEMVADSIPTSNQQLVDLVTTGCRSINFDKLAWFNPAAVRATNFTVGRHGACPAGYVIAPKRSEVSLLHYKHLGSEYIRNRNRMLKTGLRPRDIAMGWGRHYLRSDDEMDADFIDLRDAAEPVPGLKDGPPAELLAWGEAMIRNSGRFDQSWYLATYPDVAAIRLDPVAHYYHYGWREGRRPSPLFDPAAYSISKQNLANIPASSNPFLSYFKSGPKS